MAYLLTGDHGRAEDLLQTALAKTWPAWRRVDDPEAYVRQMMVNTYVSWWRRRWRTSAPTEYCPTRRTATTQPAVTTCDRHGPAAAGQRAVLVLRYYEDLTEAEMAASSAARSAR